MQDFGQDLDLGCRISGLRLGWLQALGSHWVSHGMGFSTQAYLWIPKTYGHEGGVWRGY